MTAKKDPNLTKHEALVLAWKNRKDYKGYDKSKGSAFNSWRGIIYTQKGKARGFPAEWNDFDNFMKDVQGEWKQGKIVIRIDSSKPYSKDNCYWGEKGTETINRLIKFEYNEKTQTLFEWSKELNINYKGLRSRYYKHRKDWCKKWILFGKPKKHKIVNRDKEYNIRTTRMYHAYKLTDKRRNLYNNLTREFVLEECKKPCIYCGDNKRIGLDRIDNTKGHTKDNVVPCCYDCNCARMDNFSFEEMLIIGKAIKKIKKLRKKPTK